MAVESTIFRQSPLTNFQTLTYQISLLADFTHLEQPFDYQNQKQPILRHLRLLPMYLKFQVNLAEVSLNEITGLNCAEQIVLSFAEKKITLSAYCLNLLIMGFDESVF